MHDNLLWEILFMHVNLLLSYSSQAIDQTPLHMRYWYYLLVKHKMDSAIEFLNKMRKDGLILRKSLDKWH